MVRQYQQHFPNENESLQALVQFLNTNTGNQLYSRKNFNGHITASAFILDMARQSLLLLRHKKLNRWLQPGGHVDETDSSIMAAALREAAEETGLLPGQLIAIHSGHTKGIFDVDSHGIPANINKNEPAHTHHDLRFLFECTQPELLAVNEAEATGFKWVPLMELTEDETFGYVAKKIMQVLAAPVNQAAL